MTRTSKNCSVAQLVSTLCPCPSPLHLLLRYVTHTALLTYSFLHGTCLVVRVCASSATQTELFETAKHEKRREVKDFMHNLDTAF